MYDISNKDYQACLNILDQYSGIKYWSNQNKLKLNEKINSKANSLVKKMNKNV